MIGKFLDMHSCCIMLARMPRLYGIRTIVRAGSTYSRKWCWNPIGKKRIFWKQALISLVMACMHCIRIFDIVMQSYFYSNEAFISASSCCLIIMHHTCIYIYFYAVRFGACQMCIWPIRGSIFFRYCNDRDAAMWMSWGKVKSSAM